ncbi:MAG: hypothetical protein HRT77_07415 [Halioglobus sp.]|nr:hypothetical protein [Halioglobus sp.]
MKQLIPIALLLLSTACGDKSVSKVASDEVKAAAQEQQVRGFVFSDWAYDIPRADPGECPEGMNITDEEFFSDEYAEVREQVEKRWNAGDRDGALELLPEDACQNPSVMPDPGHILFEGNAAVAGIDLDGENSSANTGGQCAHDDFVSADGVAGIDNQHYRLMGCVKGFRPDGLFDRLFDTKNSILENGYSPLLELTLVEGTADNGRVEARLFTSAGPVTKDANNNVVPDMSQLVHEDTLYHSDPFPGQIKDGIFTAGPVDAKLRFKVQAIDNHYYFKDLQIRAEMLPNGGMKGVLAGYWDIENTFDFLTEVYIGPIHLGRAAANNIGYMCSGVYHALPRVADGHPDPETGNCTSMSTVIKFEAVPAFVIMPEPENLVALQ